jgi:hypothetical protein
MELQTGGFKEGQGIASDNETSKSHRRGVSGGKASGETATRARSSGPWQRSWKTPPSQTTVAALAPLALPKLFAEVVGCPVEFSEDDCTGLFWRPAQQGGGSSSSSRASATVWICGFDLGRAQQHVPLLRFSLQQPQGDRVEVAAA